MSTKFVLRRNSLGDRRLHGPPSPLGVDVSERGRLPHVIRGTETIPICSTGCPSPGLPRMLSGFVDLRCCNSSDAPRRYSGQYPCESKGLRILISGCPAFSWEEAEERDAIHRLRITAAQSAYCALRLRCADELLDAKRIDIIIERSAIEEVASTTVEAVDTAGSSMRRPPSPRGPPRRFALNGSGDSRITASGRPFAR